jgi:phosphoglycerol transferase MdoB-like AlkP superfamily enzyme
MNQQPEENALVERRQTPWLFAQLLVRFSLPLYVTCFIGRLVLCLWLLPRLADIPWGTRLMAFVHGIRMDTIAVAWLTVPVVIVACLAPSRFASRAAFVAQKWSLVSLALLVFVEVATFPFFAEYDARPNFLFTAYVEYPRELLTMLWSDQKIGLALAAVLVTAALWWRSQRSLAPLAQRLTLAPLVTRAAFLAPLSVLLFLGIRSSLGHRPANTSDAFYCQSRIAGELAKNSLHGAAYEAYRGRKDGTRLAAQYGKLDRDEAHGRVAQMLRVPLNAEAPFRRTEPSVAPTVSPRNLVIIIEESMGARFVGHLGDQRGLTPSLDELSGQSLTFRNLHASGTRSIRGLSALSAGFLAIPGEGVLKRPKSQSGFFTLSSLLEPKGYHSSFIYGGEARFDNMRGWYTGNGFDLIVEEKDYEAPLFRGSWGVSDEDLMNKAIETYRGLHREGRPFVSVIFSSSNHTPFDLPDGKIDWVPNIPRTSVENAIKYADFAIGHFFQTARSEPFHANTVYVVVADHDIRVHGDAAVPVDHFHIPGLIHGTCVPPGTHDEVASQPDLLATALSYLGVELDYPVLGTPIHRSERDAFALMQFNEAYGFRRGEKVAVLRPSMAPQTYVWRDGQLSPTEKDSELELDGLSLIHVAEDLYERRLYR